MNAILNARALAITGTVGLLIAGLVTASGTASAAPTIYEAENATIVNGVVEANWTGFTGTGLPAARASCTAS